MPVSPSDFFDLSVRLHSSECDEITRRCVVSRAYYAALHSVAALFDERPQEMEVPGESTHARIIGRAVAYAKQQLPGRMYAAEIAKLMPRLRRVRNVADYELDEGFEMALSADVAMKAKRILELCEDVRRMRAARSAA